MLVMFRFKNYGPFKEEAVLDMRAVKAYKEHPDNLITEYPDMPLLKVTAIYGANASGKSQFVDAYESFRKLVRYSFQSNNETESQSVLAQHYHPYALDMSSYEDDTEFEVVFRDPVIKDEYRYGFTYNAKCITSEWFYRTSLITNRQSIILERSNGIFRLGASVKRTCEKYIPEIDSDVLAVSFFKSLKLKNNPFQIINMFIFSMIPIYFTKEMYADVLLDLYFKNDFDDTEKQQLLDFLRAIDVGIQDIEVEKNGDNIAIYSYHRNSNGTMRRFSLDLESDGTRRAIAIYSFLRRVTNVGGLIMDEFHSQLHPLLQKYLLDMFYESSVGGQLIYTTHDTTMLDKRFTRRDQIWFTEKNENGESSLYSLADFKVRDFDSFEKDYLSGNYGAIPNLKDFSFYGGTTDGEG